MVRVVIYHGSKSTTIDITLTVGFYRPSVGDFAYSNGSFSPAYDNTLELVGIVYYSNYVSSSSQEVRVLSKDSIYDILGPCRSYVGTSGYGKE